MNNSILLMNEAVRLHRAGKLSEAGALYRRVLAIDPQKCEAHSNLGAVLRALGDFDGGEQSYRKAIAINPNFADAHANLANLLKRTDPREALTHYERAIALKEDAGFIYNYGLALHGLGRVADAATAYRRSIALRPEFSSAWNNLGIALADQNKLDEAASAYRQALAIGTPHAQVYNNLGLVLLEQGAIEQALDTFDKGIALSPGQPDAWGNRAFAELYRPDVNLDDVYQLALKSAATYQPAMSSAKRSSTAGKPRLGFVSADFRGHAVGVLALPALEGLAKAGFEIVCYSNSRLADYLTDRFKKSAYLWRDISMWSDAEVVTQIEADAVDLLFDLSGHSRGGRLGIFAHRAAPIQIAWIGYPATTGLSSMDYLLADFWQVPVGMELFYTETILRLNRPYVAFEPIAQHLEPGPLPALTNEFVTFASFNALKKINTRVIKLWSRLLRAVPRSRLIMKCPALDCSVVQARVSQSFLEEGIIQDRLDLLGGTSAELHIAKMAEADLALDSFPYSGGLTTLECLWMGLPVVSWPGETLASRHSFSYLNACGLTQLCAKSAEDYLRIAIDLAVDIPRLMELRSSMRRRLLSSKLMDTNGFVVELSALLMELWSKAGRTH